MKGSAITRPRDLPYGENGLELRWYKRRWYYAEPACPKGRSPSKCRRYRPVHASGRERSRVTRRHSCDEVGGLSASPVW
ncbi:hypothetical protein [Kitasatospora sp. NPDC051914]|uniref:hypothetical protein n=1 Tax=Kitasatospora sp. NPDC051914 TaxID=3154945 RepID=UPI00343BDEAE